MQSSVRRRDREVPTLGACRSPTLSDEWAPLGVSVRPSGRLQRPAFGGSGLSQTSEGTGRRLGGVPCTTARLALLRRAPTLHNVSYRRAG